MSSERKRCAEVFFGGYMSENPVRYKAHPDWEGIDEIRIRVVPRFKTSRMSGDGWRVSAVAEFFRKGKKIHEASYRNIDAAAKFLSVELCTDLIYENTDEKGIFRADPEECGQPGCLEASVNHYRLKEEFSDRGEGPLPPSNTFEYRRAFCMKHSVRGDCGLEDADRNYELVQGPGHKTLDPEDVSPSAFGGVINLSE